MKFRGEAIVVTIDTSVAILGPAVPENAFGPRVLCDGALSAVTGGDTKRSVARGLQATFYTEFVSFTLRESDA
jgi:hypothetical protein